MGGTPGTPRGRAAPVALPFRVRGAGDGAGPEQGSSEGHVCVELHSMLL